MAEENSKLEATSHSFDSSLLLASREQTWKVLHRIAEQIQVGMSEEEANNIAQKTIREMGSEKSWHRHYVRFGPNTTKAFGEESAPNIRLGSQDIFFIDIGPVFHGYEGDAGKTFCVGTNDNYNKCANDAEKIFSKVKDNWQSKKTSGVALYEFAQKCAEELGWMLNLHSNGHRLSDFPHASYYRGSLQDISFHPRQYAWVLEIQIRHPQNSYGAFFEDLLI